MSDEEIFESYSMFANTFSYLGLPITRDIKSADLVVMGIPYDLGTTGRAGTRHGPQSIRAASANLRWEEKRWPWTFDTANPTFTGTVTAATVNVTGTLTADTITGGSY